jgi:tRNA(Ile)-lysidine synthase
MAALLDCLRETVQRHQLLGRDDRVLVAVSGGVDSLVLLHLLRFGVTDFPLHLEAAHFDHRMRSGSGADADWVRGLCRAWEVPVHVGHAGVIPPNEASARAARYSFLENVANEVGATRIATAHHADDQAETVLFRIRRGTGLDGLSGIPVRRGRVVRPLLGASRAEIEAYARAHALTRREDPTNWSRRYARNRIRHDLLPRLEAEAPGVRAALVRLAERAAGYRRAWSRRLAEIEQAVITAEDTAAILLAREKLLEYHPDLRARLLRRFLGRLGDAPGRAGTAALQAFINSGQSGSTIHLKDGLRAEREFDAIRLSRSEPETARFDRSLSIVGSTAGTGQAIIGGRRWVVHWAAAEAGASENSILLDPARIRFPLLVRSWAPGDRIRLPIGSKKLKKLFAEKRWGRLRRQRVPVLVDANREVLWVVGLARAAGVVNEGNGLRVTVRDGQLD